MRSRVRFAATAERPMRCACSSSARASLPADPQQCSRTVGRGSHLEGRNEVKDLRSKLTAAGDRALPDAGVRPALIIPPSARPGDDRIDGGSQPARRRAVSPSGGRGGGATRKPDVAHRVGWLLRPNGPGASFSFFDLAPAVAARIFVVARLDLFVIRRSYSMSCHARSVSCAGIRPGSSSCRAQPAGPMWSIRGGRFRSVTGAAPPVASCSAGSATGDCGRSVPARYAS